MSLPPHREKDAKVEGRDPPETGPKETMAPFRTLMGRLLNVPMSEIDEQQRSYEAEKREAARLDIPMPRRKKLAAISPVSREQPVQRNKQDGK